MFKIQMYKKSEDNSQICIAQCNYLVQKHGINFNFDTNPAHYIPLEDPDDETNVRQASYVNSNYEVGSLADLGLESEE